MTLPDRPPVPSYLVDGGYLSWAYGLAPLAFHSWNLEKMNYRDALFVLEGDGSFRKEYWELYKYNRRPLTPEAAEKKNRVDEFRRYMAEDWLIWSVKLNGLEADDLIAVLHCEYGPLRVLGVDKDYMQLPGIDLRQLGGGEVTIGKYRNSQPKKVHPWINTPDDILLTLALLGDVVDNIPRLVRPYGLDDYIQIMDLTTPGERYSKALSMYGDAFTRNIYLAVLPGPWVYDPIPNPEEVLVRLADGSYRDHPYREEVQRSVLAPYHRQEANLQPQELT